MNDLIGALGLPGAAAALVLCVERGFALARAIYAAKNGTTSPHGNGTAASLAGLDARLAIVDRDLLLVRKDIAAVPDRISRGMSSVAARCEEIIDPLRRQVERIEQRMDEHIGSGQ